MKRVLAALALAAVCYGQVYPNRWFYFSRNLQVDRDVEDFKQLARTASEHGLNGVIAAAHRGS